MKSHLTVTHDILQLVPYRRRYRLLSAKTSCSVRCFWKCLFLQDVWSAAQFDPVDSQSNVTLFRGCRLLFHSKHPALWPSETMQLYMILCGLCKSLDIKYVSSVLRIKEHFFFFLKISSCFFHILSVWPSSPVSTDPVGCSQTGCRGYICQRWGQCDFTMFLWQPSGDALLLVPANLRRWTWAPYQYLQVWQTV